MKVIKGSVIEDWGKRIRKSFKIASTFKSWSPGCVESNRFVEFGCGRDVFWVRDGETLDKVPGSRFLKYGCYVRTWGWTAGLSLSRRGIRLFDFSCHFTQSYEAAWGEFK